MKKLSIILLTLLTVFASCDKNDDPINDNPSDTIPDNNDDNNDDDNDICTDFTNLSTLTSQIRIIDFINDNEGWAVGTDKDDNNKSILLHSTDGGKNWTAINSDLKIQTSNIPFPFLKFINATDAYMIGKPELYSAQIKYTTDKGATWTVIPNPSEKTYAWKRFASNSTETIFMTGNEMVIISNTTHEILNTFEHPNGYNFNINSGVNFSENGKITTVANSTKGGLQVGHSTNAGGWTFTPINLEYIYSIDFPTDNIGYIYGNIGLDNYILKTTDGAASWTQKTFPQSLTEISFADANNGVGISYDDVFKTTDGGDTWVKISNSCFDTNENLSPGVAISYPTVNNIFAAGLYRVDDNTTNAGIYITK